MAETNQAPAPLRIIAWLTIATGAFMVLGSLMGLLASAALGSVPDGMMLPDSAMLPDGAESITPVLAVVLKVARYFWLASLVQLAVAVVAIWSGIDLLRLRAWARTANEVFCWLTLLVLALYAVFWVWLWLAFPVPQDMADFDPASMRIASIVMLVVIEAIFVVPTVAILRYLRGPQARAAVAGR
jgi:hypothetical protein